MNEENNDYVKSFNIHKEIMITTIDNPYDPFEDYDAWFLYDVEKGYYTPNKIARIGKFSDEMTMQEQRIENERAINRLIEIDPLHIYKKIEKIIDET